MLSFLTIFDSYQDYCHSPMKKYFAFLLVSVFAFASSCWAQDFALGHAQRSFVDSTRSNRSVTCEIYYPSDAVGDEVPIAVGDFPVLVFGHGFVMTWSVYDIYWTALVPKGYIFVLPTTETSLFPSHDNFGQDMAFLAAQLQNENQNAASLFYQSVANTSAVLGHSMGGGSAFLAMNHNANITALATMAPAETNPSAVSAAGLIDRPSLVFSGINDCVAPPAAHQLLMYNALSSNCKSYVGIVGGDHCQFASSNFNCTFGQSTCSPQATISATEQQSRVLTNLVPWLDYYLKGICTQGDLFQSNVSNSASFELQQNCVVGCSTGIAEENHLNFSVYPNPSADVLRWKGDSQWVGQSFSIVDIQGRVLVQGILSETSEVTQIANWSEGLYVLRVGQALIVPFSKN
jgi:dienelactone hydrolase